MDHKHLSHYISAASIALLFMAVAYVVFSLPLPHVWKTYPDEECICVVSDDKSLSCDNLPTRYEVIWVSPTATPPSTSR